MKIFLSDFDGTLVNKDILDVLCGINGKEEESKRLNEEFVAGKRDGLPTLKQRIDFLAGVTYQQLVKKLDENNYLVEGAEELFKKLKARGVITVLHSGNLVPVLKYYQSKLEIDYIVGNMPRMEGDVITGIELADFAGRDFKVMGCREIINKYAVDKANIIAIGDSPADLPVFAIAGLKIVINAKNGIDKEADIVLESSLAELIPMLDSIL
ncbi:MAG: HAD family phosphatase [Lachnospiraceae bacterium]|jgi:phosphoserine phosphatase|nr:HAD family phosphatase [Lachnospiraceae bacterium]